MVITLEHALPTCLHLSHALPLLFQARIGGISITNAVKGEERSSKSNGDRYQNLHAQIEGLLVTSNFATTSGTEVPIPSMTSVSTSSSVTGSGASGINVAAPTINDGGITLKVNVPTLLQLDLLRIDALHAYLTLLPYVSLSFLLHTLLISPPWGTGLANK
jgi:hypothetical protein